MSGRKRRTQIAGQFAAHRIDMLRSPAWRVLSLSARRVLDRIEIEHADHGGAENGRLPVTYEDFRRYGIHRHAIGPAIREVVALGFAEITEAGRAGNAEFRKPNLFRLTYRNTNVGPTDEWQKITKMKQKRSPAPLGQATASKTKRDAGKRQISVTETGTEKPEIHSTETITTSHRPETNTTLDISGRGLAQWAPTGFGPGQGSRDHEPRAAYPHGATLRPRLSPTSSACRSPTSKRSGLHCVSAVFLIRTRRPAFIASKLWTGGAYARHPRLFPELTSAPAAAHAGAVFDERMRALDG